MRTALRSSRVRKWAAFVLFLLMLGGWIVSFQYSVRYQNPKCDWVVVCDGGGVLFAWYSPPRWNASHVGWQIGLAVERREGRTWLVPQLTHPRADATWLFVPLLPFLLVVLGAACWLFWKDNPPPPTHCRFCGYDMKGNVSGVCPECGTKREGAETNHGSAGTELATSRKQKGDGTR